MDDAIASVLTMHSLPVSPPPSPCVLAIDPDPETRKSLLRALAARGLRTAAGASIGKALARLRSGGVDAVAVHASEPDPTGVETCRHIVASWPAMPIVVIVDAGALGAALNAFEAGAFDYLVGPVDRPGVADALAHAAEMGRLRVRQERRLTPVPAPPVDDPVERRYLLGLLAGVGGDRSRAARILGVERPELYERLTRLGVMPKACEDETLPIPISPEELLGRRSS